MNGPHIYIPNRNIIEARDAIVLPSPKVGGVFTLEAVDPQGRRRFLGKADNLVLDNGLLGLNQTRAGAGYLLVGSGTTPPLATDIALETFVAVSGSASLTSATASSMVPYRGTTVFTGTFVAPGVNHTLGEVAFGWATTNTNLFSRALITDQLGNPTTVVWLSTEQLVVTYTLYTYPYLEDTPISIVLADVTYTGTMRAVAVSTSTWIACDPRYQKTMNRSITGSTYSMYVANLGGIQTVTYLPALLSANVATMSNLTADTINNRCAGTATWGTAVGNLTGGISNIWVMPGWTSYQIYVTPNIPKTNTMSLTLNFTSTQWGR